MSTLEEIIVYWVGTYLNNAMHSEEWVVMRVWNRLADVQFFFFFEERLYEQNFIGKAGRTWYLSKFRGVGEKSGWYRTCLRWRGWMEKLIWFGTS